MRCAICLGDHPTKKHKKFAPTKEGETRYRCTGCGRYLIASELKAHKKLGCKAAIGTPDIPLGRNDLRGRDDHIEQQPD